MTTPLEKEIIDYPESILGKYVSHSQNELESIFAQGDCSQISDVCKRIIQAGGKRLRPLLTLLACEAVEGDFKKAVPVSVATELAHTLSIIQDDIFDQATLRRGVEPIHVKCGIPTAILASDFLFLKMVGEILKTANADAEAKELTLKVLSIVVEAGLEAVEGEHLDLLLTDREEATVEDWIVVAKKKTGSLMKAALEAGALIGGGRKEDISALRNYGESLGVAYQIADDVLDLTGSSDIVGKDIGSDVTNKRMTVVAAHALQNSIAQRDRILQFLGDSKDQQNDLADSLAIFESVGSIDFARKLALEYAEKAMDSLEQLRPTEAKMVLEGIPLMVVNRKR